MPTNSLITAATGGSPGATPSADAASGGAGATAQKQVTPDQVKQALAKQMTIDRGLRGLLKNGKPIPRKEVIDFCISLVSGRVFTAQEMAGYMTSLPDDPMKVRDWVQQHADTVDRNLMQMMTMIQGTEPPEQPPMPSAEPPLPEPTNQPPAMMQ